MYMSMTDLSKRWHMPRREATNVLAKNGASILRLDRRMLVPVSEVERIETIATQSAKAPEDPLDSRLLAWAAIRSREFSRRDAMQYLHRDVATVRAVLDALTDSGRLVKTSPKSYRLA